MLLHFLLKSQAATTWIFKLAYLILTSLVWAFSYGLIKSNLGNLDPNFVTFCRMACALLVFTPFLRFKNLKTKHAIQLIGIGAIQYGLMYLCFLRSFRYLDAYQAALFTTFTPLYVILFNDMFAKKFHAYYLKVACIAVLGGMVIYYKNIFQAKIIYGFLLVQMSDICFAFGQVAYKRLRNTELKVRDQDIYALLFFGALLTAAFATTSFNAWGDVLVINLKQVLVLSYLGAIASGICFFLWNKGAVTINAATLAVFNNLKSPLAIAVSIIFFKESTNIERLVIGMGLIALALYMAENYNKRTQITGNKYAAR
jgi:drug/metabolite transporter (DMT)-like permease